MYLLRILTISVLLWSSNVLSNTDSFKERFKLRRDSQGKLIEVIDNSMSMSFSIRPYLESIKNDILRYQDNASLYPDFREAVFSNYEDESLVLSDNTQRNLRVIEKSLTALENLDVDRIFEDKNFKKVITGFEDKFKEALSQINPKVMANVLDRRYFYKRHVTYQVLKWGLGFAKKNLSSIPVLNTVSYMMVEIESKVRERRLYHQNMLLHYLNNFKAEELGLTHEEVGHIFSSIYESRISWWGLLESNKAVNTWDTYGTDNFYSAFRLASKRLILNRDIYSEVGDRLNFAFQNVNFEGDDIIVNLFNQENMFNGKPAIAFYINDPKRIMKKRLMLNLAEVGLSFVPLPNLIKSNVENYLKSFYESQKLNEGSLYAYFEANKNKEMMSHLLLQYGNPFDTLLFLIKD